jgi:hypothetical protein
MKERSLFSSLKLFYNAFEYFPCWHFMDSIMTWWALLFCLYRWLYLHSIWSSIFNVNIGCSRFWNLILSLVLSMYHSAALFVFLCFSVFSIGLCCLYCFLWVLSPVIVLQRIWFGYLQYLPCNNHLTVVIVFTTTGSSLNYFALVTTLCGLGIGSACMSLPAIWSFWIRSKICSWICIVFTFWALLLGCPALLWPISLITRFPLFD